MNNIKLLYLIFLFSVTYIQCNSQGNEDYEISNIYRNSIQIKDGSKYKVEINLNEVNNDELKIIVYPPKINVDVAYWAFPATIPGTYEYSNFGLLVSDLKAFDSNGKELKVKKGAVNENLYQNRKQKLTKAMRKNIWKIFEASKIHKIEYTVEDSYDNKSLFSDISKIPGMAGTNFEKEKNFVLNWPGIIGFYLCLIDVPYELEILKPHGLYGATSLPKKSWNKTIDRYFAKNYAELVDCPVMYSIPDTTSFKVGNTVFEVAVFDENGEKKASEIADKIKPAAEIAYKKYLSAWMKDKYTFIFYLPLGPGIGALEHKSSSFYFINLFSTNLKEIIAHEFLHVLTPFGFSSKQIANLQMELPVTSKHLWLYEGVTEYFSMRVLSDSAVYNMDRFYSDVETKIKESEQYKAISLIKMSNDVYNKEIQDFVCVYSKGAIVAFLLDIRINELTQGKKNLIKVISELREKYKAQPFDDEQLINDIIAITHPDLKNFFEKYVLGTEPLPVKEYKEKIGLTNEKIAITTNSYTYGIKEAVYNMEKEIVTLNEDFLYKEYPNHPLTGMGKIKITKINGLKINSKTLNDLFNPNPRNKYFICGFYGRIDQLSISANVEHGTLEQYKIQNTPVDSKIEYLTLEFEKDGETKIVKIAPMNIEYKIISKALRNNLKATEQQKLLFSFVFSN